MSIPWLFERMAESGGQPAIIWRDQTVTYGALLNAIAAWHRTLDDHGIGVAQVVVLEGDYSADACALLLALIARHAIIVPLSGANPAERKESIETAEAQTVITLTNGGTPEIRRRDTAITHFLTRRLVAMGKPGLVLFSSGATGKAKAVLHDFTSLLEKFRVRRRRMRTLSFLLMDHIGGINTLFYTLANGGTIIPVEGRDPDTVCRTIARHRVQLLPTSPTFLNLLLISEAYRRYDLSSLELVTYGTEVMPESTLLRIREAMPHVRFLQTYGLSEIGILRSKSRDSRSLWVKIGGEGIETKIVDGVLWIRATSAMMGYLNAPSPFDADGWLNTHDMVERTFDGDGSYVRFLGRATDVINVGGQKVYPVEVESVLLQVPNVRDAAVFAEKSSITGQIVVARVNLFEPELPVQLRSRVRAFCRTRLAPHKIPAKIEITDREQRTSRFKKMRRPEPGT